MSHFAKVVNKKVVKVISAEESFFEKFIDDSPGEWLQTSYNTMGGIHYGKDRNPDGGVPLRKNFAAVGYTYDATRDAFIPPKPYPSWTLNEETCLWDSPVPHPNDGQIYNWNEETQTWDIIS